MTGVLLLSLCLCQPPATADRWFGADKVKHFLVSAFAQSLTYSSLQLAGADGRTALAGATAATLTLGVGKELFDRRRGGRFSGRDLVWDAAGMGSASLVLVRTER